MHGETTIVSGTLSTNTSHSLDFQLGNVLAGTGYTIILTSVSDDEKLSCLGVSGPFVVAAHATVHEDVQMICEVPYTETSEPVNATPAF